MIISFIFDKQISIFFTSNRSEMLNAISIFINNVEWYALFGTIFLVFLAAKKYKELKALTIAFLLYSILTLAIKLIISRERPFVDLKNNLVNGANPYRSFPSGHATAVSSLIPFFNSNNILSFFWIFIAIIVSLSRVYLGVHYLSDVIAGFLLGSLIGEISIYLSEKYKSNKKITHRKV